MCCDKLLWWMWCDKLLWCMSCDSCCDVCDVTSCDECECCDTNTEGQLHIAFTLNARVFRTLWLNFVMSVTVHIYFIIHYAFTFGMLSRRIRCVTNAFTGNILPIWAKGVDNNIKTSKCFSFSIRRFLDSVLIQPVGLTQKPKIDVAVVTMVSDSSTKRTRRRRKNINGLYWKRPA